MEKHAQQQTQQRLDRWLSFPAETLVQVLKNSCRLCMASFGSSNNRISLFTTDRNDLRLLEMANDLTGSKVSDQSDYGLPMDCCLGCAGKLVNFYEFREACQKNEKEFDTIYTAIRLKLKFNQSNAVVQDDADMQVIYVCRCCKLQFENNAEYLEHKKIHGNGTPNTSIGGETSASTGMIQVGDLNEPKLPYPIKLESDQEIAISSFPCHQCSETFDSLQLYTLHDEMVHKIVPPLVLRRNNVLRASETVEVEQINVDVDPNSVGSLQPPQLRKQFKCKKCPVVFSSIPNRIRHEQVEHKSSVPVNKEKRKRGRPGSKTNCRHCNAYYDNYVHKYRHEKKCLDLQAAAAASGLLLKPKREFDEARRSNSINYNENSDDEDNLNLSDINGANTSALSESRDDNKARQCSRCHEEFSSSRAKTIHEKNVHNLDIRECRVCKRVFSSYPARYMHEKRCVLKPPPPHVET